MTPYIEARLRAGIQNHLDSKKQNPVTVRDLFGCGWTNLSPRTRSTLGAWMLKKVRKGAFPGVQPAGRNTENTMTYSIAHCDPEHM